MLNLNEMAAHAGIAGKINTSRRPLNYITTPKRSVAITQAPPGEMLRRYAGHTEFCGGLRSVPPIKIANINNSTSVKKRAIPETGYKAWSMLGVQPNKCLNVQMIVMIVADEYEVDGRQVFKPESG